MVMPHAANILHPPQHLMHMESEYSQCPAMKVNGWYGTEALLYLDMLIKTQLLRTYCF